MRRQRRCVSRLRGVYQIPRANGITHEAGPRIKPDRSIPFPIMDINDITEEQKTELLYHFRAAVLARAQQWDHELKIETILGYEVELDIEMWAANVDDATGLVPDDLAFVEWDDVKEELIES